MAVIALFRGINVGGHHKVKMENLRALFESMGLRGAQTYVQSGNVVFETDETDLEALTRRIEEAFVKQFGFESAVVLRATAEMRDVIARNPFTGRELDPSKVAVTFFASDLADTAREAARAIKVAPEEFHIHARETYTYFPEGMGKTKMPSAAIAKALKIPGTARNWNSVTKLLAMAEKLESPML